MDYRIVVDSCTDLTKEMMQRFNAVLAPLTINIDGKEIVDDESFDQKKLIWEMKNSKEGPKTSCPSPNSYAEKFKDSSNVFVVTLSDKLSGSYNSAVVAKQMIEEEYDNLIHVFNSKSAAIAQVLIVHKIFENIEMGLNFKDIVEKVEKYISEQKTLFVLESLENLRKNGRLTNIQGVIAGLLSLKPLMLANDEGLY